MKGFCKLIVSLILFFVVQNSFALVPEQHLSEPQEQRARELFLQIKCPVCAGQVIESSNTEIAFQLRKLVREKISDGKSDEEIKNYLVTEYGGDILNSPTSNDFLLWILPLVFRVVGIFVIKKLTKVSV
jgi:cytochrome c-type biogenesis protein CcmH